MSFAGAFCDVMIAPTSVVRMKILPHESFLVLCFVALSTKASEILEASMEAGLTLKEAEDVIFSNTRTLQFFNSVDLKQVRIPMQIVNTASETVPGRRS